MSNNKLTDYSFQDIIGKERIRIPMIQRDYAEGRKNKNVSDIRKNFINELLKPIFGKVSNMKLDFVYGYDRNDAFEPLDGQQRLTTLFLLYWIFRPKEANKDILRNSKEPLHSLFTYATRITSEEFCNTLVNHYACDLIAEWQNKRGKQEETQAEAKIKEEKTYKKDFDGITIGDWFYNDDSKAVSYKKDEIKLSNIIRSKDWFEWGWHKDPTVNSMLVVIDEVMALINKNGYTYSTEYYVNLSNITFNMLDLDKLEMSDELYVKMNSRGKNLSSFDIIKSTFEEEIQLQGKSSTNFEKDWRDKVDGKWMYYFWQNYRKTDAQDDQKGDEIDKEYKTILPVENSYLRLLQRLVALNLLLSTHNQTEYNDLRPVFACRSQWGEFGFEQMMQYYLDISFGKIGSERILNLVQIMEDMDALIYEYKDNPGHYCDITKLLKGIHFQGNESLLDSYLQDYINYDTLAMFASMLFYARMFQGHIFDSDKSKNNFRYWMRFTRNTILNDNRYAKIDKIQALDDTLELLQEILQEYGESNLDGEVDSFANFVVKYLDVNRRRGIENERVAEEKIKTRLRLSNSAWKDELDKVEENDYLCGQVCSLLDWSGENIDKFDKYYSYLKQIVSNKALKDQNKFYAAMLTFSDYRNKTNHTLYTFNKQRDRSLKQYLRIKEEDSNFYGSKLKDLIDCWMENYPKLSADEFFDECIKNSEVEPTDWRYYVIHCPQIMDFAREKIIVKLDNGYWYLRSKIRADVEHHEIYLESIRCRVILPLDDKQQIDYNNPKYATVIVKGNTDKDDPNSFYLITKDDSLTIHIGLAGNKEYELKVNNEPSQILPAIEIDKYLVELKTIRPI